MLWFVSRSSGVLPAEGTPVSVVGEDESLVLPSTGSGVTSAPPVAMVVLGGECSSADLIFTAMVGGVIPGLYDGSVLFPAVGVYISKSSYVRQGEHSLDTFYKPFHTVVYYRYLRFFADGGESSTSCDFTPLFTACRCCSLHDQP